jgi:hypothetical protein
VGDPPPPPDLAPDGGRRLGRVLADLTPAQRADPATVRAAVTTAYGPPATVLIRTGTVIVRFDFQCLVATVPARGAPVVRSGQQENCL